MRHFIRVLVAVLLIAGHCSEAVAGDTIRINGSGSALDMMQPIVAAYRKAHPNVTIIMDKPLGSSGAIKALLAGVLDFAVSSKVLKPEEAQLGAFSREYGKTPLLFVTNLDVKIKNISTADIESYYSGNKNSWPNGKSVRLILRPEGDIDTKIIRGLSPSVDAAVTAAMQRPGMITSVTDPEAAEKIAVTSGAIGAASLTTMIVDRPKLNQLALNGVSGTVSTLADGSYPLAKDIRFILTANTSPASRNFLDFVFSAKGRAIAAKSGVLVTASTTGTR